MANKIRQINNTNNFVVGHFNIVYQKKKKATNLKPIFGGGVYEKQWLCMLTETSMINIFVRLPHYIYLYKMFVWIGDQNDEIIQHLAFSDSGRITDDIEACFLRQGNMNVQP